MQQHIQCKILLGLHRLNICRSANSAREELVLAQRRLGRCIGGTTPNTPQLLPAPARNMGRRLQQAYTHMWKLQLSEGWQKLKVIVQKEQGSLAVAGIQFSAFTVLSMLLSC